VGLDHEVEFFDQHADHAEYDVLGERGYARSSPSSTSRSGRGKASAA
jgi:hypothetical protein